MTDVCLREARYKSRLTKKMCKAKELIAKANQDVSTGKAFVNKFNDQFSRSKPGDDLEFDLLNDAEMCFVDAAYNAAAASDIAFTVLVRAARHIMSVVETDIKNYVDLMDDDMQEFVYRAGDILVEATGIMADIVSSAPPNCRLRCKHNRQWGNEIAQSVNALYSSELGNVRHNRKSDFMGGL